MANWESWWTPIQRQRDAADIQQGLSRVRQAQIDGPNSIAAQWNPNNYGSILSREHPELFGPQGLSNPAYQQQLKQQDYTQKLQQKAAMSLQLDAEKRRQALQNGGIGANFNFMSSMFDDGEDDDGL